jgi:hypothetical protein
LYRQLAAWGGNERSQVVAAPGNYKVKSGKLEQVL